MKNMIDYAKDSSIYTMNEKPFNELDALLFAQLAYLKWELLPFDLTDKTISFKEAMPYIDSLTQTTRVPKENTELYMSIYNSVRFDQLRLGYVKSVLDKEISEQFLAITFEIEEGIYDISFRGTDATIIGWKEDLEMSYSSQISSHSSATQYFEKMQTLNGKYRLIGHSKGGNLAAYIGCVIEDPSDILHIYNFDGPGFLPGTMDVNRIYLIHSKFIPRSSIIGLLMQEDEHYTIMNSNKKSILQHDPFTWSVLEDTFETLDTLDKPALFIQRSVNQWLIHSTIEKRRLVIDTLFSLIEERGKESFSNMKLKDWITVIKEYKGLDDETKLIMTELASLLIGVNWEESKKLMKDRIPHKKE